MAANKQNISQIDDIYANFAKQNQKEWNYGVIKLLNDHPGIIVIALVYSVFYNIIIMFLFKIPQKIIQDFNKQKAKYICKLLYPSIISLIYFIIVNIVLLGFKLGFSRPIPSQTLEYHSLDDQGDCFLNYIPPYTIRKQDNICNFSNIQSFFSGHVELIFAILLSSIIIFYQMNDLQKVLQTSNYINEKVNKILIIYNYISVVILIAFLIILTPLTMIARIIAYKHFWSDVVTSVVMCLFLFGVISICTLKYQKDEFIKDKYNRLEDSLQSIA